MDSKLRAAISPYETEDSDGKLVVAPDDVKRPICPKCHTANYVRPILYGLVDFTPKLEKELEEGRYSLGGCVVEEYRWDCTRCHIHFTYKKP